MAETADRTVTQLLREQHEMIKALFEQVGTEAREERAATFECLRSMLAVHETAEEEVVHPAARRMGDAAERAVAARLEEESKAKRMLADLEKVGPDDERFDEMLAEFEAAVVEHAEAEEQEIFPFIESMDAEQLRTMADALLVAERLAPTHPHPHAPESAIGNLLTGPMVAMVDRVRDAIKRRAA